MHNPCPKRHTQCRCSETCETRREREKEIYKQKRNGKQRKRKRESGDLMCVNIQHEGLFIYRLSLCIVQNTHHRMSLKRQKKRKHINHHRRWMKVKRCAFAGLSEHWNTKKKLKFWEKNKLCRDFQRKIVIEIFFCSYLNGVATEKKRWESREKEVLQEIERKQEINLR